MRLFALCRVISILDSLYHRRRLSARLADDFLHLFVHGVSFSQRFLHIDRLKVPDVLDERDQWLLRVIRFILNHVPNYYEAHAQEVVNPRTSPRIC